MTIIPFVFLVLGVLTVPTAFGQGLTDQDIDIAMENAAQFTNRMGDLISECEDIEIDSGSTNTQAQECMSVISKFNTQNQDLESTHGNIINKMVPPIQEEEEEEDENDVPNEATTEQDSSIGDIPVQPGHTIIPGGDVDQTYINEQSDSLQTPGNTAGQVGTDHDDSSSDDNDSQLNEDSGNKNKGEGEGD